MLFICGLDAYRTGHSPRIEQHVDQGCDTLSFEIPGNGDPARIIARGISTGSYYAFRAAHPHADRLFAAVAPGGACHHMFDPARIGAQDQMEYPFASTEALVYTFGYRDTDAAAVARDAAEDRMFSLVEAGIVSLPTCKLMLC